MNPNPETKEAGHSPAPTGSNTFGILDSLGNPRTMFKPAKGKSYFEGEKAKDLPRR